MGWAVKFAGKVADVQRAIFEDQNIPAPVKEMLANAAALVCPEAATANYPPPAGLVRGVLVESMGHYDPAFVGSCVMNVQAILLAVPPASG